MTNPTIMDVCIKPLFNYVEENWVYSDDASFMKKHCLARGVNLFLVPASFIAHSVDTIVGLGAGIGLICTLGKHRPTFNVTFGHLGASQELFSHPYNLFLKAINPKAPLSVTAGGEGFTSNKPINSLKDVARKCYKSENFLKRHVASRLTYVLLAVTCLVTRAIDGVISVPASSLSILTVGKFVSLNHLAYRTLQMPGIINDLFYCTIKFINPWVGTSRA